VIVAVSPAVRELSLVVIAIVGDIALPSALVFSDWPMYQKVFPAGSDP